MHFLRATAVAALILSVATPSVQAQQTRERVIEQACNVYVSKDYSPKQERSETCKFTAPAGWGILSAEVNQVENFKGRGTWTHNIYAAGQIFEAQVKRLIELKQKNRVNFDAAVKEQNAKLLAEIEEEYRQLNQLEETIKSSHNLLEVKVTASGGRFSYSRIRVIAKVTLWQPVI